MTKGTIAAGVPMVVPTMKRVKGMIQINRIRKGMERRILVIMFRILLSTGFGVSPPGAVEYSKRASGMPKI